MSTLRHRASIAIACAAVAIAVLYTLRLPIFPPSEKAVLAAQDQVYEAVVRDMTTRAQGEPEPTRLVFDAALLIDPTAGGDTKSCRENARESLRLENKKPPYNSPADRIYRIFASDSYDDSLRADTIQDFLKKSCSAGRLSETFHTDLPKIFVTPGSLHFADLHYLRTDGPKSFEQLFPGADGIISFSGVGFDSSLDEAIVSTSFVCGGLCGSGHSYVLRKRSGRWQVVDKWMVWVS